MVFENHEREGAILFGFTLTGGRLRPRYAETAYATVLREFTLAMYRQSCVQTQVLCGKLAIQTFYPEAR